VTAAAKEMRREERRWEQASRVRRDANKAKRYVFVRILFVRQQFGWAWPIVFSDNSFAKTGQVGMSDAFLVSYGDLGRIGLSLYYDMGFGSLSLRGSLMGSFIL
jgi:hypothetical protein